MSILDKDFNDFNPKIMSLIFDESILIEKRGLEKKYRKMSSQFKEEIERINLEQFIDDEYFSEVYCKSFINVLNKNKYYYNDNRFFGRCFYYSEEDINILLDKINKIQVLIPKYNDIMKYAINNTNYYSDYYGGILEFIFILFDNISYNIGIVGEIYDTWNQKYREEYDDFEDFQGSEYFKKMCYVKTKQKYILRNNSLYSDDFLDFLIESSEGSDFQIKFDDKKSNDLFYNKLEFFREEGNEILNLINQITYYN